MTRVKSCIATLPCSSDSSEPGAGPSRDRSVEFTFIEPPFWFLEHEVRTPGGKFPRGLRRIVGGPFRLAPRRIMHESHDSAGGDDIRARADQGRVGLQFLGDMGLGVARIEDHHDLVARADEPLGALDDLRRDGISLDERNVARELVVLDRPAVLGAYLDVDPDDTSIAAHRLEQGGVEDQRTSVSHAGLDNDIGLQCEDDLLQPDQVFRMLDDRSPEPCERVGVFLIPAGLEPQIRKQLESLFAVEVQTLAVSDERIFRCVDYDAHEPMPPRQEFNAGEDAPVFRSSRSSPLSIEVGACQPSMRSTFAMSATSAAGSSSRLAWEPNWTSSRALRWSATLWMTWRTATPRPVPTL